MGLILDSSVAIAAERRGDTIEQLIQQIIETTGDQDAALSAVGLAELVHGVYRAKDDVARSRRAAFVDGLAAALSVYPFTEEAARIAGRIDAERRAAGVTVPVADLLIAATALSLSYSVLTVNLRDFRQVPGLSVIHY